MKLTLIKSQVLLSLLVIMLLSMANSVPEESTVPVYDRELVKERLKLMSNDVIVPKYTSVVEGYIKGYTIRNRAKAERILGRSIVYFPLFEEYLKKHNLPLDLKYLSVVESALAAKATSRVGAGGLWQFMPGTAKQYGLEINQYIDERSDPIKATEAAMLHLAKLYKRFKDWPLALAAYNSGSGRVRRAIRRSGRKDFWRLKRYLPRETRNYVPAFIGANYLLNYFEAHNLKPEYPVLDIQLTETIKVFGNYSFYQIAQLTDIPLDIIETLNPAYEQGIIPYKTEGHYLTLPKRVMPAFQDFMEAQRPDRLIDPNEFLISGPVHISRPAEESNANYVKSSHTVQVDESLHSIAAQLNCSLHQLKAWNNLTSDEVIEGQVLIVYIPKEVLRYSPLKKVEPLMPISVLLLREVEHEPRFMVDNEAIFKKDQFVYFTIPKKIHLKALRKRFPAIDLDKVREWNEFNKMNPELAVGRRIKIQKKW